MISTISELKLSLIHTILEKYEILLSFKYNNATFFLFFTLFYLDVFVLQFLWQTNFVRYFSLRVKYFRN